MWTSSTIQPRFNQRHSDEFRGPGRNRLPERRRHRCVCRRVGGKFRPGQPSGSYQLLADDRGGASTHVCFTVGSVTLEFPQAPRSAPVVPGDWCPADQRGPVDQRRQRTDQQGFSGQVCRRRHDDPAKPAGRRRHPCIGQHHRADSGAAKRIGGWHIHAASQRKLAARHLNVEPAMAGAAAASTRPGSLRARTWPPTTRTSCRALKNRGYNPPA